MTSTRSAPTHSYTSRIWRSQDGGERTIGDMDDAHLFYAVRSVLWHIRGGSDINEPSLGYPAVENMTSEPYSKERYLLCKSAGGMAAELYSRLALGNIDKSSRRLTLSQKAEFVRVMNDIYDQAFVKLESISRDYHSFAATFAECLNHMGLKPDLQASLKKGDSHKTVQVKEDKPEGLSPGAAWPYETTESDPSQLSLF